MMGTRFYMHEVKDEHTVYIQRHKGFTSVEAKKVASDVEHALKRFGVSACMMVVDEDWCVEVRCEAMNFSTVIAFLRGMQYGQYLDPDD